MQFNIIVSIVCFIMFVSILAIPKIPNILVFLLIAPISVFTGVLNIEDVTSVFTNNILMLIVIIGIYTHLMSISQLDLSIGEFVDRSTKKIGNSKDQERTILAILYLVCVVASAFMQNLSVAMALLPTMYGISKVSKISRSKMILFVIYASTLGGAMTLIGTPTNMFANAALIEAGIEPFKFFDFAWVAAPIAIFGGLYLVFFHKMAPSYDDWEDSYTNKKEITENPDLLNKQKKWTMIGFIIFVISLVMSGFFKSLSVYLNPYMVGFFTLALLYILKVFDIKEFITGYPVDIYLFNLGILVMIKIISKSGLGEVLGHKALSIIGDSKNLYFITIVLFLGSAITTQFMNNMATAGVLAPIGISIANVMGADPRAIVLTIAIGAGCCYLTPIASGTNQSVVPFSKLKFQDFAKYGWPLLLISLICCVLILPRVFPFFP